jgi:APA family basic amino acid/polyamine antiporter
MVGAGIFTTTGFQAADLKDPTIMLAAWVLGGLLALAGALSYGELGAMMPAPGAEVHFLARTFGAWIGWLAGFVTFFAGFAAPIALVSLATGAYVERTIPWISAGVVAPAVVVSLTAVHALNVTFGARVNDIACLLKILLLIAFVVAGLLAAPTRAPAQGDPNPSGFPMAGFAISLIFVSFAYSGWNGAAYVGGEVRDPGRLLPRSLFLGTLLVTALYVLVNIVYLRAASPAQMAGVEAVGHLAATRLFGDRAGGIFSIGIALLLFSTVSAMAMTGPRVLVSLARDGNLPPVLAKTSRRGAPTTAVVIQGAIALALLLTSGLRDLIEYAGLSLSLSAGLTVLGLIVLRRRLPDAPRPFRVPGYPLLPLAFVLLSAWMIVRTICDDPMKGLGSAATLGLGILLRPVFSRRGKGAARGRA